MLKTDLRERLLYARKDELEATSMYSHMATIAPTLELGQIVASIAADEYGHARTFLTMLAQLVK